MGTFVETTRGGQKLVYHGYGYVKQKPVKSNMRWVCEFKNKSKCGAAAFTALEVTDGCEVEERGTHSHAADAGRLEILRAKSLLKKQAEESTAPAEDVVSEVFGTIAVSGASKVPGTNSLKRNVERWRKRRNYSHEATDAVSALLHCTIRSPTRKRRNYSMIQNGSGGHRRSGNVSLETNVADSARADYYSGPSEPMEMHKEFTTACVQFVAFDLRPFNSVSGEGFQKVVQAAIEVGASKGRINATNIIPRREIVQSKTRSLASDVRSMLRRVVQREISDGYCSITTNTWTDECRQLFYLSMTIHYIDSGWTLHDRVLATKQFVKEPPPSRIHAEVLHSLRSFGLGSLRTIVFVTDRVSSMASAFRSDVRLNCVSYAIENLLENVLRQKPTVDGVCSSSSPPSVRAASFIQDCLDLATYLKQSNLFSELDASMDFSSMDLNDLSMASSRWTVHLSMLFNIDRNYDAIERVLHDAGEDYRLAFMDRDVLKILIQFLTPFKELVDTFEEKDKPTLHLVAPRIRCLLDVLEPRLSEPPLLIDLKRRSKAYLEENFELHQLHGIALFLNPRMRSLKALDEDSRGQTIEEVREMMSEMDLHRPQPSAVCTYDATTGEATVRQSTNWDEMWEDDEVQHGRTRSVDSEIELYKRLSVPNGPGFDLLEWWKSNSVQLPRLSNLARRVLCIPASSTHWRWSCSQAGLNISKIRDQLNPNDVDDLLLLRSNFDLIK